MSNTGIVAGPGSNDYDVYLGFWINWSHGKILGSTLTTSRQNGGLLISFLAIYVGATGTSFWRIGCFIMHWILSSHIPEDGLYHQRQAILRNSESALDGTKRLLQTAGIWRNKARRPILRLVPGILFALITLAAFGVTSIFSSRVTTKTANEVLLSGKHCGFQDITPTEDNVLDKLSIQNPFLAQRHASYLNYATECYSNLTDKEPCQAYIKSRLNVTANRTSSCPFAKSICRSSENLILDSGYLGSHIDFGVNAPPTQRFQFRRISKCAPLVTEGYTRVYNDSRSQSSLMRHYYGEPNPDYRPTPGDPFMFEVPMGLDVKHTDDAASYNVINPDYTIGTTLSETFTPIPELQQPLNTTFLVLVFLSAQGITYLEPVDDPWYSAHQLRNRTYIDGTAKTFYSADEPAGVLGCTIEQQICNPNSPNPDRCRALPILSQLHVKNPTRELWTSEFDQEMMNWVEGIIRLSGTTILYDVIQDAGALALTSRSSLTSGTQIPLPSNQWQTDLIHLFSADMASLQAVLVESATGPPSPQLNEFTVRPNASATRYVCQNQKILSARYSSFNVFGVATILIIGGLIMLLDLFLEMLVDCIQERKQSKSYKSRYARLEWKSTSTLQFQRLAHEELGWGSWSHAADTIPVTAQGDNLGTLDISDEKHPLLRRPPVDDAEKPDGDHPTDENMSAPVEALATDSQPARQDVQAEHASNGPRSPMMDHTVGPDQGHGVDNGLYQPTEALILRYIQVAPSSDGPLLPEPTETVPEGSE